LDTGTVFAHGATIDGRCFCRWRIRARLSGYSKKPDLRGRKGAQSFSFSEALLKHFSFFRCLAFWQTPAPMLLRRSNPRSSPIPGPLARRLHLVELTALELTRGRIDMVPGNNPPASFSSSFSWSIEKLRFAALVLVATALPAAILAMASVAAVRVLGLTWLFAIARLAHGIARRATSGAAVLMVDQSGILDLRLMPRRIGWHEIETVFPVNIDRSRVVDLSLRSPGITLAGTRWLIRLGAIVQQAQGVPAITISMLLLDGQVVDLLAAIARYRPDLVPASAMRHATAQ
jgi:hypothetical protein